MDEEIEDKYGRIIGPAVVEVTTKNQKTYTGFVEFVKGHPNNPMNLEEVEEKFRKCAAFSPKPLSERNLTELIAVIRKLEESRDVSQIMELLK